jgi:hypothetical protein
MTLGGLEEARATGFRLAAPAAVFKNVRRLLVMVLRELPLSK